MKKAIVPGNQPATLLDSAAGFLIEAFSNYRAKKQSFAIVHAVTAAELVLKERLARIHPNLIFRDIDALNVATKKTVSLDEVPRRLLNLGIKIKPEAEQLVHQCAKWRNQIVHHLPDFDPHEAEIQFPKMLNFIASFMRRELNTPIETVLPPHWYKAAKVILEDWKHAIAAAQLRAKKAGHVLPDACPRCGSHGVLSVGDQSKVYCHLCRSDEHLYQECARCGRISLLSFRLSDKEHWCLNCEHELIASLTPSHELDLDLVRGK
jgi:HEPN domain-containing protein